MQQLLTGHELSGTSAIGDESNAAELAEKSQKYSLKLVDVNSTNKGTKSGGVQSFSAMVVVGNHQVGSVALSRAYISAVCMSSSFNQHYTQSS